jgi:hypothetical protein
MARRQRTQQQRDQGGPEHARHDPLNHGAHACEPADCSLAKTPSSPSYFRNVYFGHAARCAAAIAAATSAESVFDQLPTCFTGSRGMAPWLRRPSPSSRFSKTTDTESGSPEHPGAADLARDTLDGRALRPVKRCHDRPPSLQLMEFPRRHAGSRGTSEPVKRAQPAGHLVPTGKNALTK